MEGAVTEGQAPGEMADMSGRARVRDLLIRRLDEAGLKPRKGPPGAHARTVAALVDHLAYMDPANLVTLADCALDAAAAPGPGQGFWPAELALRGWAQALQERPFGLHRIVTSWLASVEGPQAAAGGYLVELYRWLRAHRRPLLPGDKRAVMEQAAEGQRRRAVIRERIARGAASEDDRATLALYEVDARAARALVDGGRAAKGAA